MSELSYHGVTSRSFEFRKIYRLQINNAINQALWNCKGSYNRSLKLESEPTQTRFPCYIYQIENSIQYTAMPFYLLIPFTESHSGRQL